MKTPHHLKPITLAALAAAAALTTASAQTTYYFDTNNSTAGWVAGGNFTGSTSFTWNASAGGFWSTSDDGTATTAVWTNGSGNNIMSFGSNSTRFHVVNPGTVNIDLNGTIQAAGVDFWLSNSGSFQQGINFTINGTIDAGSNTFTIRPQVGGAGFSNPSNQNIRINSVIQGSNGLLLDTTVGSRNVDAETRLGGNNTYTGVTTIRDSSLAAYNNNAFGATGAGNDTLVEANGRAMFAGSTALTIGEDFRVRTVDASSASGTSIRASSANHILNGNVTFVLGSAAGNNDRGFNVNTNNTLTINGNITTEVTGSATNPRILFSATGGSASRIVVNGAISQGGNSTVRLLIDGNTNGTLSGITELAGNNTFTGDIAIRRGTLLLSSATPFGNNAASGNITFGDGTGDSTNTLRLLTNTAVTVNRTISLNNASGNNTYGAVIGGDSAHSSVYNGNITINTANLAGSTLQLTAASGGSVTFNGLINDGTNSISINKTGAGIVNLARAGGNTYDGGTTVSAGTLLVNNTSGSGTGTGAVTVLSGATLGGNGIITGATTINGTLAPGNSPGTLTISNALTLTSNATLAWEINVSDTTVGGGINDLVTGVTNLTLDGTINFTLIGGPSISTTGTWRLFNYSGTLTNSTLDIGSLSLASGFTASIDTSTAGQVNLVVVPEPATWALLAASLTALVIFRRRRNTHTL